MGVVENVKEVADLVQKMGNIDLYRKIMNLEEEIFQLTRQLRESVLKIEQLEDTLKFKTKLVHKPPLYFADGDKIPYCPRCWEHLPPHPISQRPIPRACSWPLGSPLSTCSGRGFEPVFGPFPVHLDYLESMRPGEVGLMR